MVAFDSVDIEIPKDYQKERFIIIEVFFLFCFSLLFHYCSLFDRLPEYLHFYKNVVPDKLFASNF